ncbi:ABC transporter permease [Microbacterium sp. RD1]|uniref:ABC transporter permease n=1 Tax=Microbacterium sp. RD1 TaxID=3457313 RepID=UPI003FA5A1DD
MTSIVQFAVLGLGVGVIYVGLATGLILVYRATGVINFAMGTTAMWGVYVYTFVRNEGRLVLPIGDIPLGGSDPGPGVALLLAVLSTVGIALVIYFGAFKPVRRAPELAQVVVSIAVMLTLQALVVLRFGPGGQRVPGFLPSDALEIAGVRVTGDYLWMTAIVLVVVALIAGYLRFTRMGVATRAAQSNERAAILMGYAPSRLAAVAMVLAGVVAVVGGVMGSTATGLNPLTFTLFIVPALSVMLVARMSSLGIAAAFGLALGMIQSILTFLAATPWWPKWAASGIDQVLPLLIVLVVLALYGKRLPARGSLQSVRLPDVAIPRLRPLPTLALLAIGAGILVVTGGAWRFGITMSLIMALLALSYVIITGYLGQISLAQVAFAGAAGFVLSKIGEGMGLPFPIAIFLSALIPTILGVIVAVPALRIRGAQLAIVTLAAALAIERFVFNNYALTPPEGNLIAAPGLFGIDLGIREGTDVSRLEFSLLVLAVAAVILIGFIRLASGDMGRAFLAVRANERAAASAGIDVRLTKLTGFAVSAFVAGVAGCLIGYSHGQLSSSSFTVFVGLQILAFAYIGGITSWPGAIVAGALAPLGIVHTIVDQVWGMSDVYALVAGVLLILTAILNPLGAVGAAQHLLHAVRARRRSPHAPPDAPVELRDENEVRA